MHSKVFSIMALPLTMLFLQWIISMIVIGVNSRNPYLYQDSWLVGRSSPTYDIMDYDVYGDKIYIVNGRYSEIQVFNVENNECIAVYRIKTRTNSLYYIRVSGGMMYVYKGGNVTALSEDGTVKEELAMSFYDWQNFDNNDHSDRDVVVSEDKTYELKDAWGYLRITESAFDHEIAVYSMTARDYAVTLFLTVPVFIWLVVLAHGLIKYTRGNDRASKK